MLLAIILCLALILRIISLNQSFWLDEAAQAVISSKPILSVNYGADFQPPFFYVFSHFWIRLGSFLGTNSEWFLRLPSVFFSLATIYVTYRLCSRLFNQKIGLITALLLATAPFHIYYAQEFRMYSLLTFLSVLSWSLLWQKKWHIYGLVILIAIFSHYFAFILFISQIVFIAVAAQKELKKMITVLLLTGSPFVLWVPTFIKQLETSKHLIQAWSGWAALSNVGFLKFPGLVLAKFTVGMISPPNKLFYAGTVGMVGLICLIALANLIQRKKNKEKPVLLVACALIVPLIIAWVGGLFISASSPWRIQFVLPFFYAFIVLGLSYHKKNLEKLLVVIIAVLVVSNLYFSSQYLLKSKFHREDWKGAIAYADRQIEPPGVVLSEYIGPWAPMEWYSQKFSYYSGASTTQQISESSVQDGLGVILDTKKPQNVVLFTYLFEISDPEQQVNAFLEKKGYKLKEEKDFRGVGIVKTYSLK